MIYELDGVCPELHEDGHFIAANASLIGSVQLGRDASIWFNTVLRGDQNRPLIVGDRTNIQDGTVCHTDAGVDFRLGADNTVGHNAIIHGVVTGDNVLIGMGATVMNGVSIGANTIIGSNALIPEGKEIPSGVLVVGAPGRVLRDLSEAEIQIIRWSAAHYVENANRFRAGLTAV